MMIRRIATARLTKSAVIAAIDGCAYASRSHSRFRFSILSSYSSDATSPRISANDLPYFLHGGSIGISFSLPPRLYSTAANPSQVNNKDYTEMAWEGIVGAVDAAQSNKQQIVESEHLMKSLLEQKDGLARRILTKAGLDNTSVLQATDNFIAKQLKVSDTGSHLSSSLADARKYRKEMGDEKYGSDLTELARRGKLDPVIGRDDEIRQCIHSLCRRTKNNPVIIGEPGVGKTAIAKGLAQRIVLGDVPEPLKNLKIPRRL